MSNQFYSYLSSKIINFFTKNPLIPGSKYNIQFEKEEQVRELYEKLKENDLYREYEYKDSKGEVKYTSYQLQINDVSLIVLSTIDNVQPDFLTRLRNMVGLEEGYEKKAILFIHNTTLDSIMGGTESFSKEGMPFNIDSIQKDIKKKLAIESFSKVDKFIIEMDLDRKKDILFSDNNYIFEYEDVLDILNKGYIDKQQYKDFGLFYDDKINDFEGDDLKNRLKDNALYFNRVDEIHNYGNPETQLEKYFDDNGISKLKNKDWMDIEYKVVKKSVENKVNTILEYKSSSEEWERPEGLSKAKSRVRNIIVFNEQGKDEVELEFSFDDYLKNEYIYKTEGEVEAKTSGYKLKVTIKDVEGKSNFYKVIYKQDNLKFEFKIAMFRCSSKYFESIKSKYTLVVKKKEQYISINTNESEVIFNEFANGNTVYEVDSNDDVIEVLDDDKLTVKISDRFQYESDKDLVRFDLKIGEERVPLGIVGTSEKTTPIEGFKVWKLKREKQCDFRLIGENKLQHGTKEYFTRDEFRKNLEVEKQILELEGLCFEENSEGIEVVDLDIDISVEKAYRNIVNYYKVSRKLPSLTYLNDDLIKLYKVFVKEYIDVLNRIDQIKIFH